MSNLEAIRREIRADLATESQPAGLDLEPEFERLLETAIAGLEPTDEWLEAVEEIVGPVGVRSVVADAVLSNALRKALEIDRLDLVGFREASGLSLPDAARRLSVSPHAMEQIEGRRPLGWLQVKATAVAAYLDSLGVRRGDFLRWLAVQLAAPRSDFAYGYRPRESPTGPVPARQDPALAKEFRSWASVVLNEAR